MNKGEFIGAVAEKAGLKKADAEKALDAVLETITAVLKEGDSLQLVGFGSFSVTKKEARTGRNPRTGTSIKIPARNAAKFKSGKELKEAVNG
ncbi:transcriptional regulator [Alphaproteobacteria bacterium]|nr:transcriptional regulator [Alphaproteobacteria bacterium]